MSYIDCLEAVLTHGSFTRAGRYTRVGREGGWEDGAGSAGLGGGAGGPPAGNASNMYRLSKIFR